MATPFSHTHISFVPRTGRRRSRSVALTNADEEDTPEQDIRRVS